jgi:LacI family transcriptional regulator
MVQQKSVNIKELSAQLNLSVTTVSRVLNGKEKQYRIKEETANKVREAAKALNYSPNQFARGLKLDRSETIGVIVPDISNPFFADLVKIVEKQLREKGFAILIGDSNENTDQEVEMLGLFESRKVDGLIVAPVGIRFDHLKQTYQKGIPMVIIDRWQAGLGIPSVTSDNYLAAFDAVSLLIENGHRSIACIQGLNNSQTNKERVDGFLAAIQKFGVPEVDCPIIGNNFTIENGYASANLLFKKPKMPTAILAMNNRISLGILQATAELNIQIPDQVSLISFDEQAYSAYLNTPMTTIEQDKFRIGQEAVAILMDKIEGTDTTVLSDLVKIPTKINLRKSVSMIR